ncbi:unnamed protein product [Amoebophrya sp. A120]|nr:unnamed protein product [Amoebophrya sp. A120]|eukprot:GSA120T00000399001.1
MAEEQREVPLADVVAGDNNLNNQQPAQDIIILQHPDNYINHNERDAARQHRSYLVHTTLDSIQFLARRLSTLSSSFVSYVSSLSQQESRVLLLHLLHQLLDLVPPRPVFSSRHTVRVFFRVLHVLASLRVFCFIFGQITFVQRIDPKYDFWATFADFSRTVAEDPSITTSTTQLLRGRTSTKKKEKEATRTTSRRHQPFLKVGDKAFYSLEEYESFVLFREREEAEAAARENSSSSLATTEDEEEVLAAVPLWTSSTGEPHGQAPTTGRATKKQAKAASHGRLNNVRNKARTQHQTDAAQQEQQSTSQLVSTSRKQRSKKKTEL